MLHCFSCLSFLATFSRPLHVFLKSLFPLFSNDSILSYLQLFTILMYVSLIGTYYLLTGSTGMCILTIGSQPCLLAVLSSKISTICSSSFSMTSPRYLIYLSVFTNFGLNLTGATAAGSLLVLISRFYLGSATVGFSLVLY